MTTICKEHEQRLPQLNGPYGTETQLSDPQPHKQKLASFASLSAISGTFNSLSKVLFIFPSRYLFAIGLGPIFSFRRQLPPILHTMSKVRDSVMLCRTHNTLHVHGVLTLLDALFQRDLRGGLHWRRIARLQFRGEASDLHLELFPVQSPLLRESYSFSFPPLTYMLKFSG